MATNTNNRATGTRSTSAQRSASAQRSVNAARARRQKAKKRRRTILLAFEIVLIALLIGAFIIILKTTTETEGPKMIKFGDDPVDIGIDPEVVQQIEAAEENGKGYMNIALFGVDARSDSELLKGSRSDSIMIASINMETGDIKLCSVYRDTYLNLCGNNGSEYRKCNAAYSYGGAEQAIRMLNKNLDMNIEHFVTVGYKGLRDVIDGLGGIYLDIDEAEIKHINNYQITICDEVTKGSYTPVTKTGYQKVDGLQAAAYCRIRYTKGDDFARAGRQREVIKAIEEQAKQASFDTLQKVFNKAIDNVYTNIETDTMIDLMKNITKYKIVEDDGFPQEDMRTVGNIGAKGSSVVPIGLEENVLWLHQFFFDDYNYNVSQTVKDYGREIKSQTSSYLNN